MTSYSNLEKLAYQRQLVGAGIGAVTGGGAGYLGSSRDADEDEGRFRSRRLRNTLIGGALGGALGGGIGHMTRARPAAAPAAAPATARTPAIAPAEKSVPTMPSSGDIVVSEQGAVRRPAAPPAVSYVATETPAPQGITPQVIATAPPAAPAAAPPRQRPPKSERRAAQRRIGGSLYANDELGSFPTATKMEIRREAYGRHRDAVARGGDALTETINTAASAESPVERAAAQLALSRHANAHPAPVPQLIATTTTAEAVARAPHVPAAPAPAPVAPSRRTLLLEHDPNVVNSASAPAAEPHGGLRQRRVMDDRVRVAPSSTSTPSSRPLLLGYDPPVVNSASAPAAHQPVVRGVDAGHVGPQLIATDVARPAKQPSAFREALDAKPGLTRKQFAAQQGASVPTLAQHIEYDERAHADTIRALMMAEGRPIESGATLAELQKLDPAAFAQAVDRIRPTAGPTLNVSLARAIGSEDDVRAAMNKWRAFEHQKRRANAASIRDPNAVFARFPEKVKATIRKANTGELPAYQLPESGEGLAILRRQRQANARYAQPHRYTGRSGEALKMDVGRQVRNLMETSEESLRSQAAAGGRQGTAAKIVMRKRNIPKEGNLLTSYFGDLD